MNERMHGVFCVIVHEGWNAWVAHIPGFPLEACLPKVFLQNLFELHILISYGAKPILRCRPEQDRGCNDAATPNVPQS